MKKLIATFCAGLMVYTSFPLTTAFAGSNSTPGQNAAAGQGQPPSPSNQPARTQQDAKTPAAQPAYAKGDRFNVVIDGTRGKYYCEPKECDPANPNSLLSQGKSVPVYQAVSDPEELGSPLYRLVQGWWTKENGDISPYQSIYSIQKVTQKTTQPNQQQTTIVATADGKRSKAQITNAAGQELTSPILIKNSSPYIKADRFHVLIPGTKNIYWCEAAECDPTNPNSDFSQGKVVNVSQTVGRAKGSQGKDDEAPAEEGYFTKFWNTAIHGDVSPYASIYSIKKAGDGDNVYAVATAQGKDPEYAKITTWQGKLLTSEPPKDGKAPKAGQDTASNGDQKTGTDDKQGADADQSEAKQSAGADGGKENATDLSALEKAIQAKYPNDPVLPDVIEGMIVGDASDGCKNVQACVDSFNKDAAGWQAKAVAKLKSFQWTADANGKYSISNLSDPKDAALVGFLTKKTGLSQQDLHDYTQCIGTAAGSESAPSQPNSTVAKQCDDPSMPTCNALLNLGAEGATDTAGKQTLDGQAASPAAKHCADVLNRLKNKTQAKAIALKQNQQTTDKTGLHTPTVPNLINDPLADKKVKETCKKEPCYDHDKQTDPTFWSRLVDMFKVGLWGGVLGGLIGGAFCAFWLGLPFAVGLGLLAGAVFAVLSVYTDTATQRAGDEKNGQPFSTPVGSPPGQATVIDSGSSSDSSSGGSGGGDSSGGAAPAGGGN